MNYLVSFLNSYEPCYLDRDDKVHPGSILTILKNGIKHNQTVSHLVLISSKEQKDILKKVKESLTYLNKSREETKIKLVNFPNDNDLLSSDNSDILDVYRTLTDVVSEIVFKDKGANIYFNLLSGTNKERLAMNLFLFTSKNEKYQGVYYEEYFSQLKKCEHESIINSSPRLFPFRRVMNFNFSDEVINYIRAYNYVQIYSLFTKKKYPLSKKVESALEFMREIYTHSDNLSQSRSILRKDKDLYNALSKSKVINLILENSEYGLVKIDSMVAILIRLVRCLLNENYEEFASNISPLLVDACLIYLEKEHRFYKDSHLSLKYVPYTEYLYVRFDGRIIINDKKFLSLVKKNSIHGLSSKYTTSFTPVLKINFSVSGLRSLREHVNNQNGIRNYDLIILQDEQDLSIMRTYEKKYRDACKHANINSFTYIELKNQSWNLINLVISILSKAVDCELVFDDFKELYELFNTYLESLL